MVLESMGQMPQEYIAMLAAGEASDDLGCGLTALRLRVKFMCQAVLEPILAGSWKGLSCKLQPDCCTLACRCCRAWIPL